MPVFEYIHTEYGAHRAHALPPHAVPGVLGGLQFSVALVFCLLFRFVTSRRQPPGRNIALGHEGQAGWTGWTGQEIFSARSTQHAAGCAHACIPGLLCIRLDHHGTHSRPGPPSLSLPQPTLGSRHHDGCRSRQNRKYEVRSTGSTYDVGAEQCSGSSSLTLGKPVALDGPGWTGRQQASFRPPSPPAFRPALLASPSSPLPHLFTLIVRSTPYLYGVRGLPISDGSAEKVLP